MALTDEIRRYWEDDALVYDDSPQHRPRSPMVRAAWTAAIEAALPSTAARVLDCGAGTGFLSLTAAELGHRVTAIDFSPGMLERLARRATEAGLDITTVEAPADRPPKGPFDAIVERHLLWTLPEPVDALRAWRAVASVGCRLVLVESLWGLADPVERWRGTLRRALGSLRRLPPEHHAEYEPGLRATLPLGSGTHPSRLIEMVLDAGWSRPRLRRLRDVEWAERTQLALPERLVGVVPRFVIEAEATGELAG